MSKLRKLRASRDIFTADGILVKRGEVFESEGPHKYGVPLDQQLPEVNAPKNGDTKPAPAVKAAREKATNPGGNPLV